MTVAKKAGIVVLVVLLLVAASFIPWLTGRVRHVNTVGDLVYLSDQTNPNHPHVWISDPLGLHTRELTHGAENDTDPSFSPDGSQIIYVSDRSGDPQVYVMDADGQNSHAVTIGSDSKVDPLFSPDGQAVTYITRGILTLLNIRTREADQILPQTASPTGTTTQEKAQQVRSSVLRYAWAPSKNGDTANTPIAAVLDLEDGSQQLVMLANSNADAIPMATASLISFDWTPDATHVVAAAMQMVGINPGQAALAKMPKGQYIAPVPNGVPLSGIFTFGTDGGIASSFTPLFVTNKGTSGPQNPAVSPDGLKTAFELWPSTTPDISKIAGIALQPLDASASPTMIIRGPASGLKWSPDGTSFLVHAPVRNKPSKQDLLIIDQTNHSLKNLTNGQSYASGGCWSPQTASQN